MLIYKEFKERVLQEFLLYMPQKYANMQMGTVCVNKVNVVKDEIHFISKSDMFRVSPTIYINDMYEDYKKNKNFKFVMKDYAEKLDAAFHCIPQLTSKELFNKDRILFQLINTNQNKELLKDIPYRIWNDLSIVYRLVIDIRGKQIISQIINYEMAERMKMKEEDFFKAAFINSKTIFPPVVKNLHDVIFETLLENGTFKDLLDMYMHHEEWCVWIVSNTKGYYGATSILYEEELYILAEQLNSDLWILPGSIHEMIAIPVTYIDLSEEFTNTILHINQVLNIEERLSNSIYYYNKTRREICFATDRLSKDLEGIKGA